MRNPMCEVYADLIEDKNSGFTIGDIPEEYLTQVEEILKERRYYDGNSQTGY